MTSWKRPDGSPLPERYGPGNQSTTRHQRPKSSPCGFLRSVGDATIPLGTIECCRRCGEARERCVTPPNAQGVQLYYWTDCRCNREQIVSQDTAVAQALKHAHDRDAVLLGDPNLASIRAWTLDRFDPRKLRGEGDQHPYHVTSRWAAAISDLDGAERGGRIPAALYFYSNGKGRGKSHLAAALLLAAKEAGRRVAFIEELRYLSLAWNMPFGPGREQLVALPAEQAWLTVIDDLGRREPGQNPASVQNAWNDVLGRRYLARRWTIVTSNYTLDELLKRGTIDDASYSRLYEMTRAGAGFGSIQRS